jgi:ankyrin repeat protein
MTTARRLEIVAWLLLILVLVGAGGVYLWYRSVGTGLSAALEDIDRAHGHSAGAISMDTYYAGSRVGVQRARMMIRKGADSNLPDHRGVTPFMSACEHGSLPLATEMLDHGAALEARDRSGATPLFYAVRSGNGRLVELLLARGSRVDARDQSRRTPLFTAAEQGVVRSVKALLAAGADPTARDAAGDTPITLLDETVRKNPMVARDFPGWSMSRRLLLTRHARRD